MSPNFFEDGSPFLNHPLLTEERTRGEIDFFMQEARTWPPATILDIGCGFGRHSIELAKRGFEVVGFDPSAAMIADANRRLALQTEETQARVSFVRADAAQFLNGAEASRRFNAAVCLMTTLGQVGSKGANTEDVLKLAAALLPQTAPFFIEIPQREPTVAALKPHDRFGSETNYTDISRQFEPATNCVTEHFELVSPESKKRFLLRYHLYSPEEIEALIEAAGFSIYAIYDGYSQDRMNNQSVTLLIHAEKR